MSKLQNYMIYESSVSAVSEGLRIANNIMKKLFEKLKQKSFVYGSTYNLIQDLNQISPKKIIFEPNNRKGSVGRFLSYAVYDYQYEKIIIQVNPKTNEYLRRFAKEGKTKFFFDKRKNQFYKELIEILSHELVHKIQHQKGGIEPFSQNTPDDLGGGYLSRQVEMDAYSIQAALEIIHGDRSKTWDMYSGFKASGEITDKVYNKFMKKVYANIKELHKLGMTK